MNVTNDEKVLIYLSTIKEVPLRKIYDLLAIYGHAENLIENLKKDCKTIKKLLRDTEYNAIINKCSDNYMDNLVAYLAKRNVDFITYDNSKYPESLECLGFEKPLVLYYKGNAALLNESCIAVVGSRKHTIYGKTITSDMSKQLCDFGFTIVSGLADGIDTAAHEAALATNGNTIAILAGGFDCIYPPTNKELSERIIEKGLLISENFPSIKTQHYMFPIRNRIISGLSRAVLVTEANERSGALITARYAIEQGKEVFAVPGNINSSYSNGTNRLIKEGAIFTIEVSDIIAELGIDVLVEKELKKITDNFISADEVINKIFDLLSYKDCHFDELLYQTELSVSDLCEKLITLELEGKILKLSGNYYKIIT